MPTVTLAAGAKDEVVIAYDELGDPAAEPVLLIAGCGQPALAWQVGVGPALVAAGYRVITFDNRGVAPSSAPAAQPWANPGRLGQYEACLAWSTDPKHGAAWPAIGVPCLVMAYEHDVDSPPARAREAAAIIPDASYVEIPDTSHLAPFTHGEAVGAALVEFFRST